MPDACLRPSRVNRGVPRARYRPGRGWAYTPRNLRVLERSPLATPDSSNA